ncbi:MAG: OmpA family protein, partial [Bacteroidetes bacterium]|nr:OmpA family protein [Bacteroidota bacterium]
KEYVPDSISIEIFNIGEPVNTKHSEYAALISADESIIYFTRQKNPDLITTGNKNDTLEHIFVTYLKNEVWSKPQEINFEVSKNKNISLAGISPDGEQLFVNIDGDIYVCRVTEGKYTELTKLTSPVNTGYWEGKASLTADGRELYFSSNRPGGIGGKDLYKSIKGDDGKWSDPVNLGPAINTIYDEDAPFIHPDRQSLYFSSKGHSTIGGYDIFQAYYLDDSWTQPRNMGYPINTVKDDIHFVLSANGKNGYFSSDKDNRFNCHDIYRVAVKKSIPLTMVKGRITAGDPPQAVKANIRVVDKETGERVKYIYNPNPKTGKYLMIFPPGKNYDMIVEAKGFLPHLVNIYIPDQEYFFELFQEIHLDAVEAMGETVGEEISVKNTFYDVRKVAGDTSVDSQNKDYGKLLDLIENIITATDSLGEEEIDKMSENLFSDTPANNTEINKSFDALFDLIEEAIETTDSSSLAKLEDQTVYEDEAKQTYYYNSGGSNADMHIVVIGNDTIYVTPGLIASKRSPFDSFKAMQNIDEGLVDIDFKALPENYKKIIIQHCIQFTHNNSVVSNKDKKDIIEIAGLLETNPRLGVDITGYCDLKSEGNGKKDNCIALGVERAWSVAELFMKQKIDAKRVNSLKWNGKKPKQTDAANCAEIKLYQAVDAPLYEIVEVIDFDEEDLKVEDIKEGMEVRLSNIFFGYNSAKLTGSSSKELSEVVKFLNDNPSLKIEIGGHTDDTGDDKDNLVLSRRRAQSVADYFTGKGIASERLVVKGYGETKPIASNDDEEGRQQNRRVVFTVVER